MQPTVTFRPTPSFPTLRRPIVVAQPAPVAKPAAKPARRISRFEALMGVTPRGFLREYVADVKHVVGLAARRDRDSKGRFIRGNRYQFETVTVTLYDKTFHMAVQALRFGTEAKV